MPKWVWGSRTLTFALLLSVPQLWSAPALEVATAAPVDFWEEESEEALTWEQAWAVGRSASPLGVLPNPTLSPRPRPPEASGSNHRSGNRRFPTTREEGKHRKVVLPFLGQIGCKISAVMNELE